MAQFREGKVYMGRAGNHVKQPSAEFIRFCIGKRCAQDLRGQENFCPLADRILEKHGTLVGVNCEEEWEKWKEEPPKEE